uniref:hypothetical protein n=1 Tax=Enterocloster aldenensis TaxID=358742 RepID=UPI0022E48176
MHLITKKSLLNALRSEGIKILGNTVIDIRDSAATYRYRSVKTQQNVNVPG